MSEPQSFSRRRLIKNALGASGVALYRPCLASEGGLRLAVIGAGAGGIATSYFLDDHDQIDIFEARHKTGGHCDSVYYEQGPYAFYFDVGAEFCHPDSHPLYFNLLESVGIPTQGEESPLVAAKGSLSIWHEKGRIRPYVSTQPLRSPLRSLNFAVYTRAARAMILGDGSYEITLREWVDSLFLTRDFKENFLIPWISSLIGSSISDAERSSARSILQTFALSFPENFLKGAVTYRSKKGLDGHLQVFVQALKQTKIHLNHSVSALLEKDDGWWIKSNQGLHGPYDQVIINAQPLFSRNFFHEVSWARELQEVLSRYEYHKTRLVLHEDPVYMPKDPRQWSVYNAAISEQRCEGSVYLGAVHAGEGFSAPLKLFKSWAYERSEEPKAIIAERDFTHPLITPDGIRATRDLSHFQGYRGIWFVGQHTTGVDLQESAVYSAMQVAKTLNPNGKRLGAYLARLRDKDLLAKTYDA